MNVGEIKLRGDEKLELSQDRECMHSYSWVVHIENVLDGRQDSLRFRTKAEAIYYMDNGEVMVKPVFVCGGLSTR